MRSNSASSASAAPQRSEPASNDFTRVELTHIQKRVEHWIRFGCPADEKVLDRRRRVLAFRPGSVFAFVRWAANDYGTIISRIDIVRAVASGEPHQTLPFVRPGGDILLKITGWPKVEQVLRISMPWNVLVSTLATLRRTTGDMLAIELSLGKRRDRTHSTVIRLGSSAAQ